MHSILLLAFLAADSSNWWTNYGDSELNRIIDKVLASNLDLQVATERIAEARALAGGAKSKLGPSINATSSAQRLRGGFAQNIVRIPQASGAEQSGSFVSPFETGLLQAGLDMKWELDFFGTNRAGYAAAKADALVEEKRQQDLAIIVSAEAARYYFELRGIEERIAITGRNIKAQRDLLSLTTDRAKAGLASQLDIEEQSVLLLNTEANLPPLRADLALHLNRLAVLMGEETFARPRIAPATKSPEVPTVSAAIPGEILKRRPDVRAAEARLAAAMSRLKQARTDLYPKITLNGLVGRQSTSLTTISLGSGNFFNVGPQLVLPWFNFGKIRSNISANDARVNQAKLAYRNELLTAFEESANALAALDNQRERLAKLAAVSQAAQTSLDLAIDLQKAGINDFLSILMAQRSLFNADFDHSTANTRLLVESVALYKALAGAWPQHP